MLIRVHWCLSVADADIKTWTKLHLVRVALTGSAFALAVTELALA